MCFCVLSSLFFSETFLHVFDGYLSLFYVLPSKHLELCFGNKVLFVLDIISSHKQRAAHVRGSWVAAIV